MRQCASQAVWTSSALPRKRREFDGEPVDRPIAALGRADDDAIEIGQRFQRKLGEVLSMRVAMKRTIDVRSRVRDHLDLADLEFRPFGVTRAGCLAAEIIADDRRGESFVGDHAVLDGVAQVDEAGGFGRRIGHRLNVASARRAGELACKTAVSQDSRSGGLQTAVTIGRRFVNRRSLMLVPRYR